MNSKRACVVAFCAVSTAVVPLALAGELTSSTVLTVSTTVDAVNGDVSSPAALIARPGPDGISLREALTAANHGSGVVAITFAASLAGKTITPLHSLPAITRDYTSLIGTTSSDGQPAVTIDASQRANDCCSGLLAVSASNVTVAHLRITGVHNDRVAISVHAGTVGGELAIHNVLLFANVLEDTGVVAVGIWVGTDFPGGSTPGATNASLTDVTIEDNVVKGYTDDGVNIGLPGTNCSIRNLVVEGNTFADNTGAGSPALELDPNFSGNSIVGTRILHNTFTGNWAGIHLNGGVSGTNMGDGTTIPATGNTISDTVIAQNRFDDNQQGIALNGGAGPTGAKNNALLNTSIVNNVFDYNTPFGAIGIEGGGDSAATNGNRIDGVAFLNDTFAYNNGALAVNMNSSGASGNTIANVSVINTIFWANGRDVGGQDAATVAPTIRTSLMGIDPRFASSQDFHLQSSSAAISAGSTAGAPGVDLDNGLRDSQPDIGAYEFGATARPLFDVLIDNAGGMGAVTSSPAGINCETACEAAFAAHTAVTLVAAPTTGSRFVGWSGACSGTGPCQVTLDADATVTATFSALTAKPALKPRLAPKCRKGQRSTKNKPCRK